MSPLADALKDSHRVTSISLLPPPKAAATPAGCPAALAGGSAAPISAYAGTIVRHLEMSGEPTCIIGWSTGGIAAIEAAAGCPHRIAGLVLLSTTARFCSAISTNGDPAGQYDSGVEPGALRAMIRKLRRDPEKVIADFLLQAVFPMSIPADELARRTQNALGPGKDSLVEGLEYLARADLRGVLRSIAAPCLVIHGRQDRIVPWRAAGFLGSNLPLSDVQLLPSIGHSIIEQGGKDLIHLTAQFVESL